MTEQEQQELNEWIAKQLGWILTPHFEWIKVTKWRPIRYKMVPPFASSLIRFAEVKREIKRRGWDWESVYESSPGEHGLHHLFLIGIPTKLGEDWSLLKTAHAETEELAGCLAFKAAIEATNGKDENPDGAG